MNEESPENRFRQEDQQQEESARPARKKRSPLPALALSLAAGIAAGVWFYGAARAFLDIRSGVDSTGREGRTASLNPLSRNAYRLWISVSGVDCAAKGDSPDEAR